MEGFISGAVAAAAVWPFETIRVQCQVLSKSTFKDCVMQIYCKQSIPGFYKGLPHGMAGSSIFYGMYFPLYTYLKTNEYASVSAFWASYGAANISSIFNNVFYVVRTRRQTQVTKTASKSNVSIFTIIKHEGLRGLSQGLGFTCLKNLEIGCISPCREYLIEHYHIHPPIATFIAKLFFSTLTYPLDTARTLQRYPMSYNSILSRFIRNPKSTYFGYTLYAARSVPSTVIAFTIHDWLANSK